MTFDSKSYIADVLKKRVRAQKGDLQAAIRELKQSGDLEVLGTIDVPGLLAITPGITDVPAHLRQLGSSVLNKRRKTDPNADLVALLIEALEGTGIDLNDNAFWERLRSAKAEAFKKQIKEFAQALALENHALKIVTEDELSDRAQALPGVDLADLRTGVESHGVSVRPSIVPPTVDIPKVFLDALKHPEYRSVVDVLLLAEDHRNGVNVIDELTFDGGKPIGPEQIKAAQQRAVSARDSNALQAAQKVLTLVKTDFSASTDLQQVLFASAIRQGKALLGQKLPTIVAAERLTATGLDKVEAARIIDHLSEAGTAARGLSEVTDMVAAGDLADARRLLDALNPDHHDAAELAAAGRAVEDAERKKSNLVTTYQAELAKKNFVAAEAALTQATRIDTGDARLREWLRQLPPPAPTALAVKVKPSGGVALSWQHGGEDCQFVVVRSEGQAPSNPSDGAVLATVKATTFVDAKAPVGHRLAYSVFALRERVASAAASGSVVAVPGPSEISSAAGLTDATVSWRLPAEAIGARCTMFDGAGNSRQIDSGGAPQATVRGLVTGQRYRFTVEAMYVMPDGSRIYSTPVTVDATPRGSIAAVEELQVQEARLANGRDGLRVVWPTVGGFPVELWSFPIDEKLPGSGTEITVDQLDDCGGRRITGVAQDRDGISTLEIPAPGDVRRILAVTVDDGRAMAGVSQVVGSAPAPGDPHVDRHGNELLVSWVLPHGDYAAHVSWTANGLPQSAVVSRADYRRDGGFRIPHASAVRDVAVSTVAFGDDQEWRSAPVQLDFDRPLPVIEYQLEIPSSRFGRRKPVRLTAQAKDTAGIVPLIAVVRTGGIMPMRVEHDDIQIPVSLDFTAAPTAIAEFDLPKLPSPFWVRLFPRPDAGFILHDPPTDSLKG